MLWLEDGVCVLSSRSLSPADAFMRLGSMGLFYHRLGLTILLNVDFCIEIVIENYVTPTISTLQGFVTSLSRSFIG